MKNLILILFIIGLLFSCSNNDSNTSSSTEYDLTSILLEDNVPGFCDENDPRLTDPNYQGTICCFQRNSDLLLNEPIVYEYLTNLSVTSISWEVESGDIEILSGQDSIIVTIKLGKNFNEGLIKVTGTSIDGLVCQEAVIIKKG